MRADYKELMGKVGEVFSITSRIEENQRHSAHDRQIIHKRIDDVKDELDVIIGDHSPCKTLAKAADDNRETHKNMNKRIADMADKCAACPVHGYNEMAKRMQEMEATLKLLVPSFSVIGFKIRGVPIWILFIALVLMGAAFDISSHWEWLMKAWQVVK
jgi:uncharacterized protein YutD